MGRKSTFDRRIADSIIGRLSQGEPLASICRDEGMPATRTVSDWCAAHPEFGADFVRARETGFDAIAAQCLDIADEVSRDTVATEQGDRPNTEWISRSKLRVETRLRLLAKWDPRRYGDKMTVAGDPEAPLAPSGVSPELIGALAQMTPEQLRALASKPLKDA